jgi:allantoicase
MGAIITLHDLSGRLVFSSIAEVENTTIDVSTLVNGTYILKMEDRHQAIQIHH